VARKIENPRFSVTKIRPCRYSAQMPTLENLVLFFVLIMLGLGLTAHARADIPDAAPVATSDDPAPIISLADPVPVPTDISTAVVTASDAYKALRTGQLRAGIALLLVLLVAALRGFLGAAVPWLRTDRGGVALVLTCALLLELSAVLQLGAPIGASLLLSALMSGCMAAGGWVTVRRLIWPQDRVPR